MLQNDQELLNLSIKNELKTVYDDCLQSLKERNYEKLIILLKEVSPMTIIKINLKASFDIQYFSEESSTLSRTLIPYLKDCTNFSFITNKYNPIASRIVESLKQYYIDTMKPIEEGFIRFALEFAPEQLHKIINNEEGKKFLLNTLRLQGYDKEQSHIISQYPQKFLWTELINNLEKLTAQDKSNIINLLSKLIINQDCGKQLSLLLNVLASREIFIRLLLGQEQIQLTLPYLVDILEMLKGMSKETIEECFKQESSQWLKFAQINLNQEVIKESCLTNEQIYSFFNNYTTSMSSSKIISLDEMILCSQKIQQSCSNYQHNLYQCALASIIVSQNNNNRIIEMPTASGKTWVQALVAMHYLQQGKKVRLIEPSELLRNQTEELLGELHTDLFICTIQQFYEHPCKDNIVIINEYDTIIEQFSFMATNLEIAGLWSLQNRTNMFFSATQNKGIEKIIKNILSDPCSMKFQSEFELLNKSSALQGGEIKICNTQDEALFKLEEDILNYYEQQPIIVYCEILETQKLLKFFEENSIKRFIVGFNEDIQKEIRSWNYGVMILEPTNFYGINTIFNKESFVLISCQLTSQQQYIQMIGRSSRSRGLCKSIYYPVTQSSPQIVIQKLKTNNNVALYELYNLIRLIWTKRNNQNLFQTLYTAQKENDAIKSLKDLQSIMGKKEYQKLIKGYEI